MDCTERAKFIRRAAITCRTVCTVRVHPTSISTELTLRPAPRATNVPLFVPPALRDAKGKISPSESEVKTNFAKIFSACEKDGAPTKWEQLPAEWQKLQYTLLNKYDKTAPYKGQPGALPQDMMLWPPNKRELDQGLWPQFNIGAYPYCFRLSTFDQPPSPGAPPTLMGQAPGTQWYHAHKHGSTALNVANGMTGALIIEGQYDDDLQKFYGGKLHQQVMVHFNNSRRRPFLCSTPHTLLGRALPGPRFQ